jgi:hypothetical protein
MLERTLDCDGAFPRSTGKSHRNQTDPLPKGGSSEPPAGVAPTLAVACNEPLALHPAESFVNANRDSVALRRSTVREAF